MKKILALMILATVPAFAWNPIKTVGNFLGGKYGWSVSVAAFGAAEASDYRTTVTTVASGAGVEANPLLTQNGVLSQNRLVAFKLITFAYPVGAESYLYWKMNSDQRKKYGKWMTVGNWIAAGAVGGVAYHNRQIYDRSR